MSWGEPSCAVVTGAASGMGLATARHFLAEGWTVVAVDRAESALDAAADDLASDRLLTVAVDVTDRAALETALDRVGDDPRLRAVVNVAGIYPPTTLADFTEAAYRRIFDVNVLGTLNVCAVTAPRLAAAGGGAIVNFASVDALAVSPGQLVYSASKAAVMSITRSLAVELASGRHHRERCGSRLGRHPWQRRHRTDGRGRLVHPARPRLPARRDRPLGVAARPGPVRHRGDHGDQRREPHPMIMITTR